MNYLKKILILLLLVSVAIGSVEAQQRKSRKKKATTQKAKTSKKKPAARNRKITAKAKPVVKKAVPQAKIAATTAVSFSADTSAPRVVTITSAFKPSLKNAAKINFTAASALVDSSRTPVTYNIPAQNLVFSYQPVPIKPLALAVDTGITWDNDNYIKVGAGNFSTALAEGAFSFGDGVNSITNIRGSYLTTKGNLPAQQYSKLGLNVLSVFNTRTNHEWTTKAYYENTTRYFYGYQPATLGYAKDDLLNRFNTAGIEVGLRSKKPNDFNITYNPQVQLRYFTTNRDLKEYAALIKAPIQKTFGKIYAFDLDVTADISSTHMQLIPNALKLNNNLFYVSPSLQFNTPNFKLNAGIRPSWDNGTYATLPNISAEARIGESNFIVEAGWVGSYNKNTFRTLTDINPWIQNPTSLLNTKVNEQYAGIKGSVGNHFTYHGRVSFERLKNQPLFPNDALDGKTFPVVYEPDMQVVKLHGEIGYTMQEKFSVLAAATYRQFTSLSVYDKAWGLLPLEMTGTLKWKVVKDLQVKADAFVWDGSRYRDRFGQTLKLDPAADLNLGVEFAVIPKLNLWLQVNNVFNNKYQRWNQYQVMGLNVLGGVVYSFR